MYPEEQEGATKRAESPEDRLVLHWEQNIKLDRTKRFVPQALDRTGDWPYLIWCSSLTWCWIPALVLMIARVYIIASIIFDLFLFITSELKRKGLYSCLNRNIYCLLLSFVIEYENGTVARHHLKILHLSKKCKRSMIYYIWQAIKEDSKFLNFE